MGERAEPMKRSAILQPLSREHHTALKLAKACEQAAQSGDKAMVNKICLRAIQAFSSELEPHFQVEESTLLPLFRGAETHSLVQRTLSGHQQLRELLKVLYQNNTESLYEFGKCLTAHIRKESFSRRLKVC
jgi:hemerythrin-like domain-containing protein